MLPAGDYVVGEVVQPGWIQTVPGVNVDAATYSVGSLPNDWAAADFDGNGTPDAVVADSQSDTVSVLLNDGNGGFGAATSYAAQNEPVEVVAADFNGDTFVDIAATNASTGGSLSVFLNNGSGTFGAAQNTFLGGRAFVTVAGDFDTDGDVDLAISDVAVLDRVQIMENNGAGGFSFGQTISLGGGAGVETADLDGDGDLDLAINSFDTGQVLVYRNDAGSFSLAQSLTVTGRPRIPGIGDIDADGDLDMLVGSLDNDTITVFTNNGTGQFQVLSVLNIAMETIALADMDGDGDLDAVASSQLRDRLLHLSNDGSGEFTEQDPLYFGAYPFEPDFADFDGDGRLDVGSVNFNGASFAQLLNRTGTQRATVADGQTTTDVDFGNFCPCTTKPSSVLSWWPAEKNARDIKGGNHGTLTNGAAFGSGKAGQAFQLDGVDDYVQVPSYQQNVYAFDLCFNKLNGHEHDTGSGNCLVSRRRHGGL